MKKSLILVGMLAVGYANAQYDGKVGINTNEPKATIDVQPSSANSLTTAKTNEGIIAPKLSKARIANIETPIEGTLVYATDNTYTGSNTKVAKITEKGYYFYNGAEWVKAGANGELWAQRDNNGVTETYLKSPEAEGLKFSYNKTELNASFKNEAYDNTNQAVNNFSSYGLSVFRVNNIGYGPSVSLISGRGSISNPESTQPNDTLGRLYFNPTFVGENAGNGAHIISKLIEKESAKSYSTRLILGARGKGQNAPYETLVITEDSRVGIGTHTPSTRLDVNGPAIVRGLTIDGNKSLGSVFTVRNEDKTDDNQMERWTFYNLNANDKTQGNYKDGLALWGYNKKSTSPSSPILFIADNGNVGIGTYVYESSQELTEKLTVQGAIKSTTLAQSGAGDRVVYADENGVLKTGVAVATPVVEVGSTTSMKCDATNRGKMNFVKNDSGSDVFGVCLRNANGNYYWGLLTGEGNLTTGGEIFGS